MRPTHRGLAANLNDFIPAAMLRLDRHDLHDFGRIELRRQVEPPIDRKDRWRAVFLVCELGNLHAAEPHFQMPGSGSDLLLWILRLCFVVALVLGNPQVQITLQHRSPSRCAYTIGSSASSHYRIRLRYLRASEKK